MQQARNPRSNEGRISVVLVVLALVATTGAGGVLILSRHRELANLRNAAEAETALLPERPSATLTTTDTDNDGLKDWEEAIYGTDPRNPDTDGDQTQDGTEVTGSRDPLIKGPDDSLTPTPTAAIQGKTSERNYTQELSAVFAQQYLSQPQEGSNPEDVAGNILAGFFGNAPLPATPVVDPADLSVSPDNSSPAIRAYFNQWAKILATNVYGATNPFLLITNIRELGDFERELPKFDPIIARYEKALAALLLLPAPSAWKPYHERTADILLAQLTLLKEIRQSNDDPMRFYLAIEQLLNTMSDADTLGADIKIEISHNGIRFEAGDPAAELLELSS